MKQATQVIIFLALILASQFGFADVQNDITVADSHVRRTRTVVVTNKTESPWSFAAGLGANMYVSGGNGVFGQSFINALYELNPKWEVGLGFQFGANLNQLTAEIDYLYKNYYVGLQAGPVFGGNSGFGVGPEIGGDWYVAPKITVGAVVVLQFVGWISGSSNTGSSASSMFSPFAVVTYHL